MVTNVLLTLKCKYLLLMTSYIASSRDYDVIQTDNSFLPFLNVSVYVHILMHFDKYILNRLKYNSNITVI